MCALTQRRARSGTTTVTCGGPRGGGTGRKATPGPLWAGRFRATQAHETSRELTASYRFRYRLLRQQVMRNRAFLLGIERKPPSTTGYWPKGRSRIPSPDLRWSGGFWVRRLGDERSARDDPMRGPLAQVGEILTKALADSVVE